MIDIDKFVASLMNSDLLSEQQRELISYVLREQFLVYFDGKIRQLQQEYKFRIGDTVRRKSDGLEARVIQALENGYTIVECEDWNKPIFVDEWELVPIEPKFKVGDKVIWKSDTGKGSACAFIILAIDTAERRYKIGDNKFLEFYFQDDCELFGTHVDLSDANPQTRHQLLAIQATQYIEEWFNGLSDEEKEDFAEKYPELVIRK